MRLRRLTVQNWRNVALANLAFEGRQHFLVGANGQGKTSLLEAAGFLTALRSFRTVEARLVIAHGQAGAAVACELEHERLGATTVTIRLDADGKALLSLVQLAAHGKLNERAAAATLAARRRWAAKLYEQREWVRELLRDAPDARK